MCFFWSLRKVWEQAFLLTNNGSQASIQSKVRSTDRTSNLSATQSNCVERYCASDGPSIQSKVRSTDSTPNLAETQEKDFVERYSIYASHRHYRSGFTFSLPSTIFCRAKIHFPQLGIKGGSLGCEEVPDHQVGRAQVHPG